jgi:lambda repressor-like predicted transcriptional regulator
MPGKSVSPDQMAAAVALRAAGYTLTAISDRTGISTRTLSRLFERHDARKGAVQDDLVAEAKRQLVAGITSNECILEEAARIVADDLAHARLLRARMADAAEHLMATNLEEAALLMRAAAAYSTAIKNTSDMLRHSLRAERAFDAHETTELPELVIREVTDEEAARIRQDDPGDGPPELEGRVLPQPQVAPGEPVGEVDDCVEEDGEAMA